MKKPQSEICEQIISILEDRREMEQAIAELKEKANALVPYISEEKNTKDISAYLYWMCPELRAKDLAIALTGEHNIHKFLDSISSITADINCERCNAQIEIKSRTQLKEELRNMNSSRARWAEGYKVLCHPCHTEIMAIRQKEWKKYELERDKRLIKLKQMPYKDYL